MSAEPTLAPGDKLGKYEIIKHLATGGMAELFLARVADLPGFHKVVAIKRILPELAKQKEFVEMFLDEARIAATLQHSNIAQMYDVGMVDNSYFISMEFLHGQDVRAIMKKLFQKKELIPVEHAITIVSNVAAGLHYAHDKTGFDGQPLNIVHRDVTPQNVMVTYEGEVKLLDFGVAKASNKINETRVGFIKGKASYLSPEQCRGDILDRRSDVFALGILMYELTLCRKLFRGKNDFETFRQIVEGPVRPPSQIVPNYPLPVEAVILKALTKNRDERYQSAREMQDALEQAAQEAGLFGSQRTLAKFMESLFGKQIEAWQRAQKEGKSLDQVIGEGEIALNEIDLEPFDDGDSQAPRSRKATLPPPTPASAPPIDSADAPPAESPQDRTIIVEGGLVEGERIGGDEDAGSTEPSDEEAPPERSNSGLRTPTGSYRGVRSTQKLRGVKTRSWLLPALIVAIFMSAAAIWGWNTYANRSTGTLVLASHTPYQVTIDGVPAGSTPLNLQLPAGPHTVVISQGGNSRTLPITIVGNQILQANLDP